MNGADIIAIIILATIVVAIVVYLLHWLYRHSSKDLSFVRTGFGGEKVVMGGGALVLPIVHDITEVSMNTLRIEVRRAGEKSLITRNRMRVEVNVEFFMRVIPTADSVATAARTLGNRTLDPESLRELVQGRFVDAMGAIAATMTMEEIHEHRGDYIRGVKGLVADSLTANGLELEDRVADQSRPDRHQAVQPLQRLRRRRHDAADRGDRDAQEEAQRHRAGHHHRDPRQEPRSREAARWRSRGRANTRASNRSARSPCAARSSAPRWRRRKPSASATSRRRRSSRAEAIDRARIKQQLAIEAENILRDQETERLEIQRRRAVEMEEQNRVVAIAVNEVENRTRLAEEIEERRSDAQRNRAGRDGRDPRQEPRSRAARADPGEGKRLRAAGAGARRRPCVARSSVPKSSSRRPGASATIEEAQIEAKEAVERARIKLDRAVDAEQHPGRARRPSGWRSSAGVRSNSKSRTGLIAVAEKSKQQSEAAVAAEAARLRVVEAQEGVTSMREQEIAERRKLIDLIEAKQQAERSAIKLTSMAAAEQRGRERPGGGGEVGGRGRAVPLRRGG